MSLSNWSAELESDSKSSIDSTKQKNYLNTYGVILRKNNRIEPAVRSYELVIRLKPNFADVFYNCGMLK